MENARKQIDIKIITTKKERHYLVSEPNYNTTKFYTENLLAIKMKKTQIHMNKPLYLRMLILELSKSVNLKYSEKSKLCYMDFIVYIKTDNIYEDITEDVERRSDASNYELNRQLPKGKNKKVIGVMKDELGGKITKECIGLKTKTYGYLTDNNDDDKKAKDTEKCVIKRKLKSKNYKNCLEVTQLEHKMNHLEKE